MQARYCKSRDSSLDTGLLATIKSTLFSSVVTKGRFLFRTILTTRLFHKAWPVQLRQLRQLRPCIADAPRSTLKLTRSGLVPGPGISVNLKPSNLTCMRETENFFPSYPSYPFPQQLGRRDGGITTWRCTDPRFLLRLLLSPTANHANHLCPLAMNKRSYH